MKNNTRQKVRQSSSRQSISIIEPDDLITDPSDISNQQTKIWVYILIIIFAIVFGYVVHDGFRLVIQKILQIPDESLGLALWGDTFGLRIIASLIGTAAGTFIIGTFLKSKVRLAAIIATLPTILFWLAGLIINITGGYSENIDGMIFLPLILIILTPIVGYFSAGYGQKYYREFQKPKSVLNIKWYHWLWIFPLYLNKVVAIPLFTLLTLWSFDSSDPIGSPLLMLIFDSGNTVARIVVFLILGGLIASISHMYSLLTSEKMDWKKWLMVIGHVLLFQVLYILLFVKLS